MGRHEIDRGGIGELGGDDEIALVLAVLVIHENIHPARPRLGDDVLGRGDGTAQTGLDRAGFLKGQSIGHGRVSRGFEQSAPG